MKENIQDSRKRVKNTGRRERKNHNVEETCRGIPGN
jgi:hypothetical protein